METGEVYQLCIITTTACRLRSFERWGGRTGELGVEVNEENCIFHCTYSREVMDKKSQIVVCVVSRVVMHVVARPGFRLSQTQPRQSCSNNISPSILSRVSPPGAQDAHGPSLILQLLSGHHSC